MEALFRSRNVDISPRIVFYARKTRSASGGTVVLRTQKTCRRRLIVFSWRRTTRRAVRETFSRPEHSKRSRRIAIFTCHVVGLGQQKACCERRAALPRGRAAFYERKRRVEAVRSRVRGGERRGEPFQRWMLARELDDKASSCLGDRREARTAETARLPSTARRTSEEVPTRSGSRKQAPSAPYMRAIVLKRFLPRGRLDFLQTESLGDMPASRPTTQCFQSHSPATRGRRDLDRVEISDA